MTNEKILKPGQTYRVIVPFEDYDGRIHPVGETWRFVRDAFLAYDDGLSLFVVQDGQSLTIRMQWREYAQGPTLDHFDRHVRAVE